MVEKKEREKGKSFIYYSYIEAYATKTQDYTRMLMYDRVINKWASLYSETRTVNKIETDL